MAEHDITKLFTIVVENVNNATIEIDGKKTSQVEVIQGTKCHWKVSAPGYRDQIGEIKVVSDFRLTLTMKPNLPKLTPHNAYTKVHPKHGKYVIDYTEIFKDRIPPVEDHENEYLWTSHGYIWWKKLDIPSIDKLIVQDLGDSTTAAISQKSMTEFLSKKADAENVYSKQIVDALLAKKADDKDSFKEIKLDNSAVVLKEVSKLKDNDKIVFKGYSFEKGVNAFATIQEALNSNNSFILLGNETFEEDIEISKDDTTIVGCDETVIRGKVICSAEKNLTLRHFTIISDFSTSTKVDTSINLLKNLDGLNIDDLDVIVRGKGRPLYTSLSLSNAVIENSRFVAGVNNYNKTIDSLEFHNVNNLTFNRNSVLGNLVFKEETSDVHITNNTLTIYDNVLIKLSGVVENTFDVVNNKTFGDSTDYVMELTDITATNMNALNIVGNHVCYKKAFVRLDNGATDLTNDKFNLSFNIANNSLTAKYIIDENTDPVGLRVGEGNISANTQGISYEEVEAMIRVETERAEAVEKQLLEKVSNEISRAVDAENQISKNLADEIIRAKEKENAVETKVIAEIDRAKNEEIMLGSKIDTERSRALLAEEDLDARKANKATTIAGYGITDAYTKDEVDAKDQTLETSLKNLINDEALARKDKDSDLEVAISRETTRAQQVEQQLSAQKADKATTLAGYGITNAYTKEQIDAMTTGMFHYKGQVQTVADLPKSGMQVGDVYNVVESGANYCWSGSTWDKLSETIDLSPYAKKEEVKAQIEAEEERAETAEETLATNLASEVTARETAVAALNEAKEDKLTSENAGEGIRIERTEDGVLISSTNATLEWGEIGGNLSDQEDLKEALDSKEPADSHIVKYKDFEYAGEKRQTIQLANHNNLSGISTDGVGHNLIMVSKWDVADVGAAGLHTNLNTKDVVTVNDKDVVLTDKNLQNVVSSDESIKISQETKEVEGLEVTVNKLSAKDYVDTKATEVAKLVNAEQERATKKENELEKEIQDEHIVRYQDFEETRKTIQLDNHNNISGIATDGTGHNLVMLSKWDVADFGAVGVHMNLNTKDVITSNDKDLVLTDKALETVITAKDDTVIIEKEQKEESGLTVDVLKLSAKQYDDTEIKEDIAELQTKTEDNKEAIEEEASTRQTKDAELKSYVDTELAKKEPLDDHSVRYQDFEYAGQKRKTIQLDNHNNISGVATDGTGHNLIMVSKWDVADVGAAGLHMNLNTKDAVTLNDKDLMLTDKALETVITAKDDSIIIEKEQKEISGLTVDVLKIASKGYDDTEVKEDIAELQTKTETNRVAIANEATTRASKDVELKSYVDEELAKKEDVDAHIVRYQDFEGNRQTIQLANHNNISGIATDGTGHNLVLLSKWDVADFGAVGVHMNLNTKDVVTLNDKDLVLTDKALENVIKGDESVKITQSTVSEGGLDVTVNTVSVKPFVEAKATELSQAITTEKNRAVAAEGTLTTNLAAEVSRAKGVEADLKDEIDTKEPADSHIVKYQDFEHAGQKRQTIQLANHNNISGIATDGTGHNLVMLSKWDVADFGAVGVHMNMNTSDVVTVNDKDVVLTDKLLGQALVPGNDTVKIVPEEVEIEGRVVTINKITAKQFDAKDILEELDKVKAGVQENKEDIEALDEDKADKATTLAGYGITNAYTKEEVDAKTTAMFHYRGQVQTVADLPTEGMEVGDVYNVIETGANYCWSGTEWDKLSETIDLTPYAKKVDVAADILAEKTRAEAAEEDLDEAKADLTYVNKELAKKEPANPNIVKFSEYPDGTGRKAIVLKNHDSLTGTLSDGSDGANLIMLSKWDVTDVGSVKVHMNLNTKDIVTVNDSDIALTDKFLGKVILAKDDSINIEEDVVEEGGISYKVQKLSSKGYDDTEVRGLISAEAATRLEKDTELAQSISTETSARESADSALEDAISTEEEARIAKDSELETAISNEATVRETKDTALETAISDEATTRETKDTELAAAIEAETSSRESKESELEQALAAETTARESKDTELETAISTEASTRAAKDTALETAISTEATTRASEDTRVLTEAKSYTDTEVAKLQDKITTLTAQVNKLMAQMAALKVDFDIESNEISLIGKDAEPTV